jgi:hypothetical protein
MDSKLDKLKKEAKKLGIELDANETIADLEAKVGMAKDKKQIMNGTPHDAKGGDGPYIPRRKPVKHINFTRRIDREAKKNG